MTPFARRVAGLFTAVPARALLTACSPGPSRDAVTERFAIELAAGAGDTQDWRELATALADDAFAGNCGSDEYRAGLGNDPVLSYAWSATCLMYFDVDLTDEQEERARDDIVDFTISGLDE